MKVRSEVEKAARGIRTRDAKKAGADTESGTRVPRSTIGSLGTSGAPGAARATTSGGASRTPGMTSGGASRTPGMTSGGASRKRKRKRKQARVQQELALPAPTPRMQWGGIRPGAGRPRSLVHDPVHTPRPEHKERHPSHINLRVVPEVGRLRRRKQWQVFRRVALRAGETDAFRVVHISIQSNHVHLLVEGVDSDAIARGMQRFASMVARALNKLLHRQGKVFAHRYHRVDITTPRQMRGALAYVLNNWRRHREDLSTPGAENELLDPYSTAWAFDGWSDLDERPTWARLPSAKPRTWLLRAGWRRSGPSFSVWTVPGPLRARARR